ncbi:MAG: YqaJ viral recombinase family protein [Lachnospiraceae bacterium]|nr:YqaJ viral recombinase family protein [Lachnospiraceae bacterium]
MADYILSRPGLLAVKTTSREEWADLRRQYIGGSDVAGIMDVSPWATPFSVWCEKLGVSAKKDNAAMRYGRENEARLLESLQDYLRDYEMEWDVYTSKSTYIRGRFCANLDGVAVMDDQVVGVEIKTTNDAREWSRAPECYILQVQHYMCVCSLDEFFLFVEGRGWRKGFVIKKDEDIIHSILLHAGKFLECVEKKKAPQPPVFVKAVDRDYARAAVKAGIYNFDYSQDAFEIFCRDYEAWKKRAKDAAEEVESFKTHIKFCLDENNIQKTDKWLARVTQVEMERFDVDAFKKDYPNLYLHYIKKSVYEKLDVRGIG